MKKAMAAKVSQFLKSSAEELISIEKTFIGSQPVPQELKKAQKK